MDFTAFVVVTQQNRMDGLKDGSFYGIVYSSTLHKIFHLSQDRGHFDLFGKCVRMGI